MANRERLAKLLVEAFRDYYEKNGDAEREGRRLHEFLEEVRGTGLVNHISNTSSGYVLREGVQGYYPLYGPLRQEIIFTDLDFARCCRDAYVEHVKPATISIQILQIVE